MTCLRCLLPIACGLLLSAHAAAQSGFRGEVNAEANYARNSADSLDAALGQRERGNASLNARLIWNGVLSSNWSLDAAYVADLRHGGDVALARSQRLFAPTLYVDPNRTALWHLDHTASDHGRSYVAHHIDRLALGYGDDKLVLRLGRQALTWGSGLVFHPLDLFNPFAPNATYTAYKPGTDMLYGQWLFDSGADIQGVLVPRRDPVSSRVASSQSSAGIKWHGFAGQDGQLGIDLLLARDYRADVLGVGASGSWGGASWSAEVVPTRLAGNGTHTSLLANMQYSWEWGGRNVNGYVEYFRNGFGVGRKGYSLAQLPLALSDRLARGTLFSVSRNYLAAGLDLQWTPLFTLKPSLIANLDDGSALLVGQAVYSLSQDSSLLAGFQWNAGKRGTEYGGLRLQPGSAIYAAPARTAYLRMSWYF